METKRDLKFKIENLIARLPLGNPYPNDLVEWVAEDIIKLLNEEGLFTKEQVMDKCYNVANEVRKNGYGGHSSAHSFVNFFLESLYKE